MLKAGSQKHAKVEESRSPARPTTLTTVWAPPRTCPGIKFSLAVAALKPLLPAFNKELHYLLDKILAEIHEGDQDAVQIAQPGRFLLD